MGIVVGIVVASSFSMTARVSANSYPGYSTSHYMTTVDPGTLWNQGCMAGTGATNGTLPGNQLIILDFGQPWYSGGWGANYWYGTSGAFASTSTIATAVENFGNGFYDCSSSSPQLVVVAGTNSDSGYVGSSEGAAWASMVATINSWFSSNGETSQVAAEGGIDAESGFFASAAAVRAWASGYGSGSLYQFFGSANGCSWTTYGTAKPGLTCTSSPLWTQDDYYYLSWGAAAAVPFPEIYNQYLMTLPNGQPTDPNAQQWEMIRRYGGAAYGAYLTPWGALTQQQACAPSPSACQGTDNPPNIGWSHLYNSLSYYQPAMTSLNYVSDIKKGF